MKTHFFTLVELLVVIAIIGILAGLLFPVLGSASASADKAQCINNQRQTAATLLEVMNTNGGFLVNSSSSYWSDYLYSINRISDMRPYRCPSISYTTTEAEASDANARACAFGVVGGGSSVKLKNGTSVTALDFRGTKATSYKSGSSTTLLSPAQILLGGCYASGVRIATTALQDAHRGETNVFCLDGHAQSIEFQTQNDLFCYMPANTGATKIKISK